MSGTSLTARLGILGWNHLDPLLLAALYLEAPVLLVGEHGTGKTLLVERLADALGGSWRHYNASLLNYDDLVGIPVPTEDGDLRFVGTKGAVWGAEFVFFDEINRCRPDLQNKLFPLVHERRLAGVELPHLRHRWAAMNPTGDTEDSGYYGTEELDAALADRFWFVIRTPVWAALTRDERERLVLGSALETTHTALSILVERTGAETALIAGAHEQNLAKYVVSLLDLLHKDVPLSPRRAAILHKTILATAGAAKTLGQDLPLATVAELVLLNGLPQWAGSARIDASKIIAAHTQAWEATMTKLDRKLRRLFEESDPVKRYMLGIELDVDQDTLGRLAVAAVTGQISDAERIGVAALLAHGHRHRPLTPAAWSAIAAKAVPVLSPGEHKELVAPGKNLENLRVVANTIAVGKSTGILTALEEAYLASMGAAQLAQAAHPEQLLATFRRNAERLEVYV
jgi:MoxR-like ATPase